MKEKIVNINKKNCHMTQRIDVGLNWWKNAQSIEPNRLNRVESSYMYLLKDIWPSKRLVFIYIYVYYW